MKILFFGAGVIGQVYAAKLFESGADVTLLQNVLENITIALQQSRKIHPVYWNDLHYICQRRCFTMPEEQGFHEAINPRIRSFHSSIY